MPVQDEFDYDVVVVGSGAGGGMAAHVLTSLGVKVLMLEAGRHYDPLQETPMFQTNYDAPLLNQRTSDKHKNYYDATIDGGWEVPGEPYSVGDGTTFLWWRTRMLGGRTNHFGRITPRFGPYDFKPFSRDGLGVDWPVDYAEMEPWYDKTEKLVGISGLYSELENEPCADDSVLQPPPKHRVIEKLLERAGESLGIPVTPIPRAVMTRDQDHRKACFYATACSRGCSIGAAFQSTTSLIPFAQETGKLETITDAMVKEVHINEAGKANAVTYVDKKTGNQVKISAKRVVLAASAPESARILLNSKSERFKTGLANSSGQVGRNLIDSIGCDVKGVIPAMKGRPRYNEEGRSAAHVYVPWWGYKDQAAGKLDFPRGYHLEVNAMFREPGADTGNNIDGYGTACKDEIRLNYGAGIGLSLRGEMIPSEHCYCEIDDEVKDKWGIPVLKFHWKFSEHEHKQVEHGLKSSKELIEAMGGYVTSEERTGEEAILPGGRIIHEVGTTRMGDDPKTSVTNRWGQCWDVDNVFVMDGGVFASNPHKNCTITILTLAMKNATYLAEQINTGAL